MVREFYAFISRTRGISSNTPSVTIASLRAMAYCSGHYFLREDEPFFRPLVLVRFRDVALFFFAALFLPPPVSLLTVAQARRSASPELTP
jgi:hypothetical protein